MLRIALAKGRLQEDFLDLIYQNQGSMSQNKRSLRLTDRLRNWEILLPKSQDVPQYLDMGMADIGVVGKDVLLECKKQLKRGNGFRAWKMQDGNSWAY
jgi:ATP phosphoribosyltransferase